MTIILGIESTAHTFGVGIVRDYEILANERAAYTTKKGGIHPVDASNHHAENAATILKQALTKANMTMNDVDAIAFSQGPGLGPCLAIGAFTARYLAGTYNKPLNPVNHCIAHLEIGRGLSKTKDPVLLYASGANTQIIAYQEGLYRVFGETLDMGIGNMIDTFARDLGLGFPGGPAVQELAKKGTILHPLPYVVKGMDTSFSGILTNLQRMKATPEDKCFTLQETTFAMLVEASERALAHTDKNELVIGGGVGCNTRLQEMCKKMCESRGATFHAPPREYLVDNAAMIAWQGLNQYRAGHTIKVSEAIIKPYERTDEVKVTWR